MATVLGDTDRGIRAGRRVVDRGHGHGHRRRVAPFQPVAQRVGEGVGAVRVGVRGIEDGSPAGAIVTSPRVPWVTPVTVVAGRERVVGEDVDEPRARATRPREASSCRRPRRVAPRSTTRSNVTSALVSCGLGLAGEVPVLQPPSSSARTVTWTRPTSPAAGVNVRVAVGAIAGSTSNRFGDAVVVDVDLEAGPTASTHSRDRARCSSPRPRCMRRCPGSTVTSPPGVKVGASLIGATQNFIVAGAEYASPS